MGRAEESELRRWVKQLHLGVSIELEHCGPLCDPLRNGVSTDDARVSL